jgi:hypothetical protein
VKTHHLLFGSLLFGSLLISSCVQISPAWGDQILPSASTTGPAAHSAHSSGDFSKVQIAQAVTPAPSPATTVWASQSLARLMDQHDCPSQTGTEPLSIENGIGRVNRYKIAAQLFSCLENWDQQVFDTQEQDTLKALRAEFKLELVALGGHRVSDPVLTSQSWTAGIGIRDFILQQSVLTVSVSKSIQPNNLFQAAQTNYGAFYQFPLTERLTLSPSIVIMTHSEKTGATPDVQGALQASFSF